MTQRSALSIDTKKRETRFVFCVQNRDYAASLELSKVYQVVTDQRAAKLHQLRVIDESGEDYLFSEKYLFYISSSLLGVRNFPSY